MFDSGGQDTHAVALRRLAVVHRQCRGGGSPAGWLRGRQARAARAVAAAAAQPAGVVGVAGYLRSTGYGPVQAELPILPPGPALSGLLDRLDAELDTLDERMLVDLIAGWARQAAHVEAAQLRAVAELAGRSMFAGRAGHGHADSRHGVRGAASVISAELRLSPTAAVARVAVACELVQELPATLAALAAGGSTATGPGSSPNRPAR
jgi:hypothetical protein